jgi:hypothetical protein
VTELGAGAGVGVGCGFLGATTATVVPGGIRPRHCQLDAGSHGPGPKLVRRMARQPPAPCGCDGWAVIAGLLPQALRCGRGQGSILLGQQFVEYHTECRRPIILRTVQGYIWRAQPKSDAIRVTRPDH